MTIDLMYFYKRFQIVNKINENLTYGHYNHLNLINPNLKVYNYIIFFTSSLIGLWKIKNNFLRLGFITFNFSFKVLFLDYLALDLSLRNFCLKNNTELARDIRLLYMYYRKGYNDYILFENAHKNFE